MTVRSLVALAVTLMPLVGCTDEGPAPRIAQIGTAARSACM